MTVISLTVKMLLYAITLPIKMLLYFNIACFNHKSMYCAFVRICSVPIAATNHPHPKP
jgi:hypothetical protein